MVQASVREPGRFCHACFSKSYPTSVPVEAAKLRLETGRERTSKGLV
jgi:glutamine phosphoribosylpyrophosphate amidotransferase